MQMKDLLPSNILQTKPRRMPRYCILMAHYMARLLVRRRREGQNLRARVPDQRGDRLSRKAIYITGLHMRFDVVPMGLGK